MMSVVYILGKGFYSDRRVLGVFSTEKKAIRAKEALCLNGDGEIIPCELDLADKFVQSGLYPYSVCISLSGDIISIYRQDAFCMVDSVPDIKHYSRTKRLIIQNILAKDDAHAIKIAGEKRIAWLVEHQNDEKVKI